MSLDSSNTHYKNNKFIIYHDKDEYFMPVFRIAYAPNLIYVESKFGPQGGKFELYIDEATLKNLKLEGSFLYFKMKLPNVKGSPTDTVIFDLQSYTISVQDVIYDFHVSKGRMHSMFVEWRDYWRQYESDKDMAIFDIILAFFE